MSAFTISLDGMKVITNRTIGGVAATAKAIAARLSRTGPHHLQALVGAQRLEVTRAQSLEMRLETAIVVLIVIEIVLDLIRAV